MFRHNLKGIYVCSGAIVCLDGGVNVSVQVCARFSVCLRMRGRGRLFTELGGRSLSSL